MENQILKIADDAVVGLTNPLKAYIELKRIAAAVELALKAVNESAVSEARKYGQKSFDDYGAHIEIRSNAGKWKYDHIPEWQKLKEETKNLEESRKIAHREAKAGRAMVDTATGEELAPAHYEEGRDNIFIKLKTET